VNAGPRDLQDRQGHLDLLDPPVLQIRVLRRTSQALPVHRGPSALKDRPVLPVRRARRDWPDIRGHRVRRVPKAREGSPAQRDHRVCPDSKENRVCRARPGHPDRLVPWGRLALRDRRVSQVLPEQFFGSSFSNALPAGGVSRAAKRTSTPSTGPVPAGTGSIWMKAPSTASRPAAMQTVSLPGPSAPKSDGAAAGCSTVAAHELSRACRMDGRAWPLVPGVSGHGGRRRSECQGGSQHVSTDGHRRGEGTSAAARRATHYYSRSESRLRGRMRLVTLRGAKSCFKRLSSDCQSKMVAGWGRQ
jgi:hypothetical protein